MMKHITTSNRDSYSFQSISETRHAEVMSMLATLATSVGRLTGAVQDLDKKLDAIHKDVRGTKNELHTTLERSVSGLRADVRYTEDSLMGHVKEHSMGWGKMLMIVAASQVVSVGAYLLYKRRKANHPKKYL